MEDWKLIELFDRRIRQIYGEENLVSLRFDHAGERSFAPLGVDLHAKYNSAVKPDEVIVVEEDKVVEYFDRHHLFDELVELSDQIIYFTAHLYMLAPHINNPLDQPLNLDGYPSTMYPNDQNVEARRFDFYSDTLAEKVYAFWARLANLLNRYLTKPVSKNSVDFSRVIDRFTDFMGDYHGNAGYQWLKVFKEKEQKVLNDQRRLIVHHQTGGTLFLEKHREAFFSREEMEELMEERLTRPTFFKSHHNLGLEALDKCLELIAELPTPLPKIVPKPTPST